MFNLAIDSKLRGCDVVAIRVEDIAAQCRRRDRGFGYLERGKTNKINVVQRTLWRDANAD
jgi:hypothetical protein